MVPLGDRVTEWNVSGVRAQLESCRIANDISASKYERRAQFFMAPPQISGQLRPLESPL
jgi:hypothetical protein